MTIYLKKITLVGLLIIASLLHSFAQIGINTDGAIPDSSAMLDITSVNKGMLVPRMSTSARESINAPATGLLVYDTDAGSFWYYENNQWNEIGTKKTAELEFEDPSLVSITGFGDENRFMVLDGTILYVADEGPSKLRAIDISDAANPTIVGEIDYSNAGAHATNGIAIKDNYIYIPYYIGTSSGGIIIVDISDPTAMTFTDQNDPNNSYSSCYRDENVLYIIDNVTGELVLYDITSAASPVFINSISGFPYSLDYQGGLYVENNLAYIVHNASSTDSGGRLSIVEVSDPQNLSILSTIETPTINPTRGLDILVLQKYQNYLLLADSNGEERGEIYDVSDATNPFLAGAMMHSVNTFTSAFDIASNRLYTIDDGSNHSISVQDITVSTNHELLYSEPMPTVAYGSTAMGTIIDKDKVYFLLTEGLFIYEIGSEYVEVIYPDGTSGHALAYDYDYDNLGDHTASENINTSGFYISNGGDDEGIYLNENGQVGIGTNTPTDYLEIPLGSTDIGPHNTINNLIQGNVESVATAWQSYTAIANGTLGMITIPNTGASSNWTVSIHQGEGTSGTILGSVSGNYLFDFSNLNIDQVTDEKYTFSISIANGALDLYSNIDYAYGMSSFDPTTSIAFELYINPRDAGTFRAGETGFSINDYSLPLFDGNNSQVLQTDGSGTVSWSDQPIFTDTDDQGIDTLRLDGTFLELSLEDDEQPSRRTNLAALNTDDQTIDKLNLNGTTLELSLENDGQGDLTVNLASLNTDNQTIDKFNLNGTTLELSLESDGQGDQTVNLAALDTDNQTIDKLNLNGTTLELSLESDGQNDQTVNLANLNTDQQTIDVLNLNGTTLEISLQGDGENTKTLDLSRLAPVGTIQMWPTNTPPTGWLICNGTSFSSSTYPNLASVLGTTNLPNFNGRFPLGSGNSGTNGSTQHNLSSNGGEEKHTLTINEMPSHNHNSGTLKTSQPYLSQSGSGTQDKRDGGGTKLYEYDSLTGHTASVGGDQSHNNMPPFYTINFIIKAE